MPSEPQIPDSYHEEKSAPPPTRRQLLQNLQNALVHAAARDEQPVQRELYPALHDGAPGEERLYGVEQRLHAH